MKRLTIEELCTILEAAWEEFDQCFPKNFMSDIQGEVWNSNPSTGEEMVKFWSQYLPLEIYNPLYA